MHVARDGALLVQVTLSAPFKDNNYLCKHLL